MSDFKILSAQEARELANRVNPEFIKPIVEKIHQAAATYQRSVVIEQHYPAPIVRALQDAGYQVEQQTVNKRVPGKWMGSNTVPTNQTVVTW